MKPASSKTAPSRATSAGGMFEVPAGMMVALVFCATLLAYAPALRGDFLWDDAGHVTAPELRSADGLLRIWSDVKATQQYYPLLHTAFWVEHRLWGDATLGYHLVNVLLHATAACLFAALLRRLAIPGAWIAAFVFALHPVAVESVAWISEQKNTLSLVFYLSAALAYLRFQNLRRPLHYGLATGLFVCALLTKTVTATLPAALLVVRWWECGRLQWQRDVVPLLPWFAVGIAAGLFTAWVERTEIGAQGADFALTPIERGLLAGRVIWFYLGKLLWPANLTFIYPRWEIDETDAGQYLFVVGIIGLLVGLVWWSRRSRGPLAGFLLFAGSLFPALGFVNVYPFLYSYVADHFQYLASLSIITLLAAQLAALGSRLRLTASAAVGLALGAMTWAQSATYRDGITLYQTTLARNPACWMAHNNLSTLLADRGRLEEALAHARRALELRRDYPEAENNVGRNLTALNRAPEALPHFERALELQPGYAEAHNNFGIALMAMDRTAEGIGRFEKALALKPNYPLARFNLGLAFAKTGRAAESLAHFQEAARLDPTYADAEMSWGLGLTVLGRFAEAVPHFERALELAPESPAVHASFGRALASAGRLEEAIARFQAALQLDPRSADTHMTLAHLYRQIGRKEEAASHYTEGLRLGARPN